MCGADLGVDRVRLDQGGSPPRVRSRQLEREFLPRSHGITSACAEQTAAKVGCTELAGDHLRVCGADAFDRFPAPSWQGSPPRVRSRRSVPILDGRRRGITSACAEQTDAQRYQLTPAQDHLRVCGADFPQW